MFRQLAEWRRVAGADCAAAAFRAVRGIMARAHASRASGNHNGMNAVKPKADDQNRVQPAAKRSAAFLSVTWNLMFCSRRSRRFLR